MTEDNGEVVGEVLIGLTAAVGEIEVVIRRGVVFDGLVIWEAEIVELWTGAPELDPPGTGFVEFVAELAMVGFSTVG